MNAGLKNVERIELTGILLKCSRNEAMSLCDSMAIFWPRRGNHFSLSSGERVGVRADFFTPTLLLRFLVRAGFVYTNYTLGFLGEG